jgi:ATP-dependent helicase/nuclease subunit B
MSYGLRLQEREQFKLTPPDVGQFFHAAMKLYGDRLQASGLDWGETDQETSREILGDVVDFLAPRLHNEILIDTARRRYLTGKIKKTMERAIFALSEHARRGSFSPVGLEVVFGPAGIMPPMTFSLEGGNELEVVGRIDRIDAAWATEGVYLRVIDYKSGPMKFSLSDVWYGLRLQLLSYLEAALSLGEKLIGSKTLLPGGFLYFSFKDPLIQTAGETIPEEEIERRILKKMKMEGMLLADPALVKMMDQELTMSSPLIPVKFKKDGSFTASSTVLTGEQFDLLRTCLKRLLLAAGEGIAGGVVDIAPYRQGQFHSCRYCLYSAVCHFDELIKGNDYRHLTPLDKDVVWSKMTQLLGGGAK